MITIKESTNTFDASTQSFDSILTGDLSDSKIVFQSNLLNVMNNLTFKVQLYFDETLIFETVTPVLYEDGDYAISNVDLSKPIRDYLITQIGLTSSDDIEDKYNAFRKINNSGKVVITELITDLDAVLDDSTITDIPDLSLWFDVNEGITEDPNGNITFWLSKVGSTKLLYTNGTINSYAKKDDDKNLIYWNRGTINSYFESNSTSKLESVNGLTIFTIGAEITQNYTVALLSKNEGGEAGRGYIGVGTNYAQISDGTLFKTFDFGHNSNLRCTTLAYADGTELWGYTNTTQHTDNQSIHFDDGGTESFKYLASTFGNNEEMYAGDLIIYDRKLSEAEILQVQTYLMSKYTTIELDTFIYKTINKTTFVKPKYIDNVLDTDINDLLLNRYFTFKYSPDTNVIDYSLNNTYSNSVYKNSDLLFNFYCENDSGQTIFFASSNNGDYEITVKPTTDLTESLILNIKDDMKDIRIFPNTNLEWEIDDYVNNVHSTGTDFDFFNFYVQTYMEFDYSELGIHHSSERNTIKFKYKEDCEKYPHQLRWLNMLGGYDTFNFDLIHSEEVQISDKGYYQNNFGLTDSLYSNDFNSSYQSYKKKYNKKYIFKTDWLTDDQIYLLEDLFKSNEVYYLYANHSYGNSPEWVAMRNLTKKQVLYHKDIKGLKRYEITIEESLKKEII